MIEHVDVATLMVAALLIGVILAVANGIRQ